jgi:hypothetical protein
MLPIVAIIVIIGVIIFAVVAATKRKDQMGERDR